MSNADGLLAFVLPWPRGVQAISSADFYSNRQPRGSMHTDDDDDGLDITAGELMNKLSMQVRVKAISQTSQSLAPPTLAHSPKNVEQGQIHHRLGAQFRTFMKVFASCIHAWPKSCY